MTKAIIAGLIALAIIGLFSWPLPTPRWFRIAWSVLFIAIIMSITYTCQGYHLPGTTS